MTSLVQRAIEMGDLALLHHDELSQRFTLIKQGEGVGHQIDLGSVLIVGKVLHGNLLYYIIYVRDGIDRNGYQQQIAYHHLTCYEPISLFHGLSETYLRYAIPQRSSISKSCFFKPNSQKGMGSS